MNLFHSFANFGNLTGCPRLFLKFVVAFIRRFLVTDRVRFLFVDGLFFQSAGRGKDRGFCFACGG